MTQVNRVVFQVLLWELDCVFTEQNMFWRLVFNRLAVSLMTKLYLEVAHSQITKMYFLKIIHLIFPQRARHCRLQNAKKKTHQKLENSQSCKPDFICPAVRKLRVQKWLFMLAWFVVALPCHLDGEVQHGNTLNLKHLTWDKSWVGEKTKCPLLQQSYPSRRAKRAKKAAAQASRRGWIWAS